jgi:integrase
VLLTVRAFYLDLLQWSLEDPARWAQWAAPCPISEADVRGYVKETRRRRARMAQRTRTLAPVLPRLVASAEQQLAGATRLLHAARSTSPGEEFAVDGTRYLRIGARRRDGSQPVRLLAQRLDEPGPQFDVEVAEDTAFWTWAVIEVLRRTGMRVEELLELTHLSLRRYQAPTGEMVALLQVSPSKTDTERVIPADPELVAVLARIIRRTKTGGGRVPLLSRYDPYERAFGPPLPHLFQRISQRRLQVLPANKVRELLNQVVERAGIVDVDGTPLRFTPHDFRRVFSTEAVNSGLPIHIAARLLGHLDLNTTQGYVAVYPAEVIRHYRRFIAERRSQQPSEEYREPTDAEWAEFRGHFSLRKVALGTCHRPYGTPCQHEHACVRCPMLRLEPTQVPRLLQIERNTRERLIEARKMRWLGEVAALEESLRHIADKKRQADHLRPNASHGPSGVDALS